MRKILLLLTFISTLVNAQKNSGFNGLNMSPGNLFMLKLRVVSSAASTDQIQARAQVETRIRPYAEWVWFGNWKNLASAAGE